MRSPKSGQDVSWGMNVIHTRRHAHRHLPVRAGHARDHTHRPHPRPTRHPYKQARLEALLCLQARYRGHGPLLQVDRSKNGPLYRVCTIATQPEFQTNASDQRAHTNHR